MNKVFAAASGIFLVFVIGMVDYWTGMQFRDTLSFSIFYVIPVFIFSWRYGMWQGIALSFLSAVVWHTADIKTGHVYAHAFAPYWNAAVRLGFFLMIAIMVSRIKQLYDDRGTLLHELASASTEIRSLRGHVPVCVWCNRIREDSGLWKSQELSTEILKDARFTHGICPSCYQKIKKEKKRKEGSSV